MQNLATEENAAVPSEHHMEWRIGIHLGDVLIEGDDILGDGVNIAAASKASPSLVGSASPTTPPAKCAARSRSSLPISASRPSRTLLAR
jgi:class 3 adenylate cyclase